MISVKDFKSLIFTAILVPFLMFPTHRTRADKCVLPPVKANILSPWQMTSCEFYMINLIDTIHAP
jgi:hypothetical protein